MSQIKDFPEKTTSIDSDCIPIQEIDGTTKHIKKGNLLTGIGGGSGSSEYPNSFTHWHDESMVLSGAALLRDINPVYAYSTISYQPSNTVGDSFTFSRQIAAGTYDITLLGDAFLNRGICSLAIDGTTMHTDLDFYSNNSNNRVMTLTRSVVVPSSALHTFIISTVGKNVNSSAYYIVLSKIWGVKQA